MAIAVDPLTNSEREFLLGLVQVDVLPTDGPLGKAIDLEVRRILAKAKANAPKSKVWRATPGATISADGLNDHADAIEYLQQIAAKIKPFALAP
jgi:hypothetical protein